MNAKDIIKKYIEDKEFDFYYSARRYMAYKEKGWSKRQFQAILLNYKNENERLRNMRLTTGQIRGKDLWQRSYNRLYGSVVKDRNGDDHYPLVNGLGNKNAIIVWYKLNEEYKGFIKLTHGEPLFDKPLQEPEEVTAEMKLQEDIEANEEDGEFMEEMAALREASPLVPDSSRAVQYRPKRFALTTLGSIVIVAATALLQFKAMAYDIPGLRMEPAVSRDHERQLSTEINALQEAFKDNRNLQLMYDRMIENVQAEISNLREEVQLHRKLISHIPMAIYAIFREIDIL